ncbi:DUF3150 domain-containing protein [Thiococcus pfennigii]|uniref:DUF3150 domain-containing protein n=1 Tax=Thiococcus pfennigii TaxID=1057 RepID=UPI001906F7BB|nr:DUF3150 domain-containing protein [Thiococcus pfennigii]
MKTMHVLDRLVAVNLDVRIWSGRKKLTAEDLSLGAAVPPEDLVSLGSKRVCDPEAIQVFHRLRRQAERVCLTGGMRFLGGYAIPEERTEPVAAQLDALGETFAQARATFVAGYGQAIEDWIALHPQWERAIRQAIDPASVVESRLGFGYQLYRIAPAERAGNLTEQVAGLGETLFGEVAQMARALEESFLGKDSLSQRALSTFRRIREKLGCLAFVDYRVLPVLASLEDWLLRTPASGPVTGALFNEGFGLMRLVGDPQKMSDHGAGILALQDLIPARDDAAPADETRKEDGDAWSFGEPLGDEAPDEEVDPPAGPWEPNAGPPVEPASFYF